MDNTSHGGRDEILIGRIKGGDTAAFRILVEKYKDVSLSLAASILKDESQAEDVLQDVFIKVYSKIGSFKYRSGFSTWLYRIVVNTCYNELKKQKIKVDIDDIKSELQQTSGITGVDNITNEEQKKYIQLAFKKMRPDEALVLRLFYLCDFKIKEIQEITGFKSGKIKVDLHRGRENFHFRLTQLLGKDINQLL